jgi:hypothetical protein
MGADEYARLFFAHVYRRFGLPRVLVSERDPRFTAAFWRSLFATLGTKLAFSSAYHPQSDGQTERANRTVEGMLRAFVGPRQNDWDEFLPLVEFAYNDSVQASTGFSPFFLTQGRNPLSPLSVPVSDARRGLGSVSPAADDHVGRMRTALSDAKQALVEAQKRQKSAYDRHRRDWAPKLGDMVLLSTSHLNLEGHVSPKLSPRFVGPFRVSEVISPVAFRLDLPATMRCHNVFYVSALREWVESSRPQDAPPPPVMRGDDAFYEVEAIIGHWPRSAKSPTEVKQYVVQWVGHPSWDSTREPAENIATDAPLAVQWYWADKNRKATAASRRQPAAVASEQPLRRSARLQSS